MLDVRDVLNLAPAYQAYQRLGGFFGARVRAIERHLAINPGHRVIDIGCGPGYIVEHLPESIEYLGFDTDAKYIDFARRRFGHRGKFFCRLFDDAAAEEFKGADLVMMNGVVHHMDDADAVGTFRSVHRVLKAKGQIFTLDGCYTENQSALVRYLLRKDRGRFVRNETGYRALLEASFENVKVAIYEGISRVPYTFIVMVGTKLA